MNAVYSIIIRAALAILSALPVERIIALLLNRLLDRVSPANLDRVYKTAQHLTELSSLFGDILSDKTVSETEIVTLRNSVTAARERMLALWAMGKSAKGLQNELAKTGLVAQYTALNTSA